MHPSSPADYFAVTIAAGISIYIIARILIGAGRFILEALDEYEGGD